MKLSIIAKLEIIGIILICFGMIELLPVLLGISSVGLILLTPLPLSIIYMVGGIMELLFALNAKKLKKEGKLYE